MMRNKYGCLLLTLACLGLAACAPASTSASDYPQRPIELVVPFEAGGSTDIAARVLSESLADELGVPVNVVNKPGADQISGVEYVRSSAPDGYTLLADGAGSSSLQAMLPNLPYAWKDRTFATRVLVGPHVYAVGSQSPADSIQEVVDQARANPADFSIAWLGGASTSDYALLQLLVNGGVDVSKIKRVPFESSGDTMTAAAAGDVDLAAGGASSAFALADSGDLRVLAITGDKPVEQLPDVPTTQQLGMPELDILYWVGISGPPELPQAVTDRINKSIRSLVDDPAFQKKIRGIAMRPALLTGADLEHSVAQEAQTFKELAAQLRNPG
jgi:tripartite-type tricarboxylate transporter receptor subunit TctC